MYQAVYKCRLCGEKFGDFMTGEKIAEMANVALSVVGNTKHIKCARNICKNATHSCKDGSYGFADFQGFKKIEKQPMFEAIYISPHANRRQNLLTDFSGI